MSFDAFELSTESGEPVELLELVMGSESWFYTNNQVAITIDSQEYEPVSLKRGRLTLSIEGQKTDRLNISLPGDNDFVSRFISFAPGTRARATLRRVHRQDGEEEMIVEYRGIVQSVSFSDNGSAADLSIAPLTAARSRPVPRLTYQSLCGHMLYDVRCKIDQDDPDFRKDLSVSAVNDRVITVPGASGFGADFFTHGFVEHDGDFRMVTAQNGDDLTLLVPFGQSPLGETVILRAGCKHRLREDCRDKFDNVVNFGGFKNVPTKNIFQTGLD